MSKGYIAVPSEIWNECNNINKDVANRKQDDNYDRT